MRVVVTESTTNIKKVYQVSGPETVDAFTKIPKSIGQMKGDLIVFRGENDCVRLPIGNDGQILVADSTTETGLRWADRSE